MITTKYVMMGEGRFALCNKLTGMYHDELAGRALSWFNNNGWGTGATAGFLDMHNGKLSAYGLSESMNLQSNEDDAEKIMTAILAGEVKIEEDDYGRVWATNHPAAEGEAANIEKLVEMRIIGE